jgi:RNA polymerase sigma factor (sigma-70 family)
MRYEGTLAGAPPSQLGTQPLDPQTTPARVDRDWQLVEALRLRAPTAAERLVATYSDRAYRLAIRITGNGRDAEEAVQDAFWSVVRKIDTFRGDSSVGSWIYRITANAAYQKLRGRAHRRDEISLDEVLPLFHEDGRHAGPISDWSASIDDPAVQTELRAALDSADRRASGPLPRRDRPARRGRRAAREPRASNRRRHRRRDGGQHLPLRHIRTDPRCDQRGGPGCSDQREGGHTMTTVSRREFVTVLAAAGGGLLVG